MPTGTYYIGGYLYSGGKPYYSHLTQSITIQAAALPTFNLTAPTSGTFTAGQTVPIQWTAGNVAAGSTIDLCYDTARRLGRQRDLDRDRPGRRQRQRHLQLEHHRRGAGHVLHRRLPLFGRHAVRLATLPSRSRSRPPPVPTFNLTAPTSGTLHSRPDGPIQWTAGNVAAGSTIALCYDTGTTFDGNATWITYSQAAANGNGTYSWNTTGVAPGTYYIGGYLYSGGTPTYSHLTQSITIQAAAAPTFNLTAPTSGTFTPGQTVQIQWTAGNVAAGSTIALCYDKALRLAT